MNNHEKARHIIDLYNQTDGVSEFLHVMKNKQELYDGDLNLLWLMITVSWQDGFCEGAGR